MRHRGQHLRRADVRAAEHADLAVRIGKRRRPFDGVVAVLRLVLERIELSLRVEPSTHVLLDDDIARRREIASLLPCRRADSYGVRSRRVGKRPSPAGL